MATNTGSNGGKNNSGGVVRGGTEGFADRGLASALEQRAYRQEYNEKVFDRDTGYLATNINNLKKQAEYYENMLKSTKDLDAAQTKMYKKRLAETRQLEAQNKQIQDRREASETEILKLLRDSHKARLKQLDEQYKAELDNIKEIGKKREEQQKKIAAHYAAEMELVQDELDEIEAAADKAGKATKKVSTGLSESVKDVTDNIMKLTNMINLQSLADNEYTKKANERYEVINKLNRTLGFDIQQGTGAYNSITSEFKTFNNNIGNLFNIDDMREYMQNAASMGLTNEKALKDNLQQSVIANKYMGLNYDTQTSMYKYMKITNNNDAIASYNKMMVALTRKNVGVNEDMLSEMIKNGQTTNDILAASGVDVTQYNQGKIAMVGSLKKQGYTDDMAQQAVSMVDNAIQSLYNGDYQSLVGMGINPNQLNSMTTGGASFDALYDYIVNSRKNTSSSARGIGAGIIGMGEYNKALGRDIAGEALTSIYGSGDSETAKELMKEAETVSDQQVEQYTKQNTAIDDLTRLSNANNVWLEDTFGNSWFDYSKMAKLAFGAAIAGNVFQAISGIGKGIGGLVKFFGAGGGSGSGLAGLLGIGSSGAGTSGGLAGLLGAAGPIAIGVAAVGATAAAIYAFNKSAADRTNKQTETNATAMKNKYDALVKQGKSTDEAMSAMWDEFKQKDNGVFQQGSEATGSFSSREKMVNGDYYNKTRTFDDYVSALEKGENNINFNTTSNAGGSILEVFSWMDKEKREALGLSPDFWKSGYDEAKTALDNAFKNNDAEAYNLIKAYSVASFLNQNPNIPADKALAAISAAAILNGNNDDKIWNALNSPKAFNGAIIKDKDTLKKVMANKGITKASDLMAIYKMLWENKNIDFWLMRDGNTGWMGYPSEQELKDNFGLDGYHLAGINRVPKDGYRAMLHKDEMVLNKSEAEAYREMFGQITGRNGTGVGGYGVGDRPFNGPYVINAGWPTYSSGKHHGGIDLSFQANTPVGSAAPGTVARSEDLTNSDGSYRSYGRLIVIKGDNGADYYYAHLNERLVGVGQRVNAGDLIGKSGSTGNSTGPHLHFEVRNPREVDPSPFLTSSVWEIGNTAGASSQLGSTSSSDSSGSSNRIAAQLAAVNTSGHRAVPGLGGIGGKGGLSSTDRIVNSVDGVSSKIINYLDEIRQEQADQRRLINAFSASQTSVNDYR